MTHRHLDGPPCEHMESHLQDVAAGEATLWQRFRVGLHAIECGPCRKFLERMRDTVTRVHAASEDEPNQEAVDRLKEKLAAVGKD